MLYCVVTLECICLCVCIILYVRKRNREHAKRSRHRKKVLTTTLQQSILQLKVENRKLRHHICGVMGKNCMKELMGKKLARCSDGVSSSGEERLIGWIQDLPNRQVDMVTQGFLQCLSDSVLCNTSTCRDEVDPVELRCNRSNISAGSDHFS